MLGPCASQVGIKYIVPSLYNHLFWFLAPSAGRSRWHISLPCTSGWLRQSSATEKNYVHQVGSTKEGWSLPLRDPCLLFTHRRGPQGSRAFSRMGLQVPLLRWRVWPYPGRTVVDELADFFRASRMLSRHPFRFILQSTRPTTSSVASCRGVDRRQTSSMLY